MSNVRISESPNHFMVLDAISRGMKTADKIAKVTRLHKSEVELIINDLVTQRLVIQEEKKGFLGRRKVELSVSHTGLQVLNAKKAELEKEAAKIQQWYQSGNTGQIQSYMDQNRMWMPMMMFSGIMNIMFFMSMMSMMGMAMNPAESAQAGDAAGAEGAAGEGAADGGGAEGAADGGDMGGGDFGGDFGGGDFSF